jgi:carbon storage regulator
MRRRAGESFLVGSAIEIEVLEVCGARVKLGIVAPDSVQIQRKETKITRDENITAARSVRRPNISTLLTKLAVPPSAPVKEEVDGQNSMDHELHWVLGGKKTKGLANAPQI